ncbi:MAG: pyridoxine 5'-phosphate synthase [Nitrospirae bacterium]|nr:pyridoxine 5'-phosphate synthase [Nitrospirota bacterium]
MRRRLFVNVDHVATVRQARRGRYPDPVAAAVLAELAGADGIIVHLREDRRHIQDRDLRVLMETIQTEVHLEMAAVDQMAGVALEARPRVCVLVPERREELTTEGGLDVFHHPAEIRRVVGRLSQAALQVSLFVDPDEGQIRASREVGADMVELHTGEYCNARPGEEQSRQLERLRQGAQVARAAGLRVAAGHGLDYVNLPSVRAIPEIEEFNIGFSIVARAVLVGFERAVREMVGLLRPSDSPAGA